MKINSFEEACEAQGYDPANVLPDVSGQPDWLQKFTLASIKRVIIADAMNEGKTFDWSNTDQYKYFPYFDMNDADDPSGFGFSDAYSFRWGSSSDVGSRLSFFTRSDAEHFGKHFIELHRDVMLVPKV